MQFPDGADESASAPTDVTRVANGRATDADAAALRRLFLDNFIVSLWSATWPWTGQIAHWSRRFAGTRASPVPGDDRPADASVAARVYDTASHSDELDDTHRETPSHPGAAVIPAALAVAAGNEAQMLANVSREIDANRSAG